MTSTVESVLTGAIGALAIVIPALLQNARARRAESDSAKAERRRAETERDAKTDARFDKYVEGLEARFAMLESQRKVLEQELEDEKELRRQLQLDLAEERILRRRVQEELDEYKEALIEAINIIVAAGLTPPRMPRIFEPPLGGETTP